MDKPAGPSSHDVVVRARRALGERSVGHTGTLDPFASGLLVLLSGKATRFARVVEQQSKTYLASARLGVRTATDDATGESVGSEVGIEGLDQVRVAAALEALQGVQDQVPPAFSAKKVAGERSYRKARRGETVVLPPVRVEVHAIELVEWAPPLVLFRAVVSPGTYLRAIARDLGERLECGAHLVALRREAIGRLRVEDAVPLELLGPASVRPLAGVLVHLPQVELTGDERVAVRHGRAITRPGMTGDIVLTADGVVAALARGEGALVKPVVVLEES